MLTTIPPNRQKICHYVLMYEGGNEMILSDGSFANQKRGIRVMVFNATFNNISVVSWLSVLLVEETGEIH